MASFWWKNILDLSEVEFCRVPRICRISKPIVVVLVSQGPSSVPHPLSSRHQFHTKVPLLFSPQNPSVPHQKTLSCTPPVQHTPLNSLIKSLYRAFLVLNWGGVLNWGVLVWNWGILGAEKEWPFCVELMYWTEGDSLAESGLSSACLSSVFLYSYLYILLIFNLLEVGQVPRFYLFQLILALWPGLELISKCWAQT